MNDPDGGRKTKLSLKGYLKEEERNMSFIQCNQRHIITYAYECNFQKSMISLFLFQRISQLRHSIHLAH